MKLFSATKPANITYRCRRVLVAQGTNGDLFYEKVNFTENFWSPVLKTLNLFSIHSLFMNLLIQGFNL